MKKRILFATYSIILIIALALFLIFHNQMQKNETNVFAESIIINGPRQITMSMDSELELLDAFVSVSPKGAQESMVVTIKAKSSKNEGGLIYNKNILTANKTGSYSVNFSVQKAKDKTLTETILVTVVDKDDIISIKNNSLTIDTPTRLSEIVTTDFEDGLTFYSNDFIIANNTICATNLGEATLYVADTKNYVKHIYKLDFIVCPKDDFKIFVNKIEKEFLNYKVHLEIENGEIFHNGQDLFILSTNNVAEISLEYPIISVKPESEGKVEIMLSLRTDTSIKVKIEFDTRDFE